MGNKILAGHEGVREQQVHEQTEDNGKEDAPVQRGKRVGGGAAAAAGVGIVG